MKCGFKIGGGIDQDFTKSPQGYTDNVRFEIYQTYTQTYTHIYVMNLYLLFVWFTFITVLKIMLFF